MAAAAGTRARARAGSLRLHRGHIGAVSTGCHAVILVIVASILLSTALHATLSAAQQPIYLPSLEFYVHALAVSTAILTTPVNYNLTGSFGQTAIFDYNITATTDANSQQLGTIRGFEAYNSLNPLSHSIIILNTITYDDGTYNGTICLHGQGNINLTSYDIPIVGGTGSFVGASGFSHVTNLRTPGNDHVFQHVLHFLNYARV